MKMPLKYQSELFITQMRWLVIIGSPLLFHLSGLQMNRFFWSIIAGTAVINIYIHVSLVLKNFNFRYIHLLSFLDLLFVSTLLFFRDNQQTDLNQLYYFVILILGIRYGVKKYFGLVFIIGVFYTVVYLIGAYFNDANLDFIQLSIQLIYFTAFGILTSFILQREHDQHLEKEELISELQAAYRQLCSYNAKVEEMATKDSLTGIYNFGYFSDRLEQEMILAKKYSRPLSVIIIDIDHFKNFNDTFGHLTGDKVLKSSVDIFAKNIREGDILARYGGEEFLILLPDTEFSEAILCAERIRRAIETSTFKTEEVNEPMNITVSAGVSNYPVNTKNPSDLIKFADKALYLAKKQGRNRIKAYGGGT